MLKLITYPNFPLMQESSSWNFKWKAEPTLGLTLAELAEAMFQVMYANHGVGLAANQIGLPLRVFVADPYAGTNRRGQDRLIAINPELSDLEGMQSGREGCLSLDPRINWPVKRAATVHFKAYDLDGEPFEGDAEGFEARILQHECDHLAGVCCIDKTDRFSREIAMKKWNRIRKAERRPQMGAEL